MKEIPFRVDPADKKGVHIVDVANGGERVFIDYKSIPFLVKELQKIVSTGNKGVGLNYKMRNEKEVRIRYRYWKRLDKETPSIQSKQTLEWFKWLLKED